MSNVSELEVPPPGPGFTTLTFSAPATEISSAEICAVTCPPFTNVVCRALPFHCTATPDTRFDPFTVKVKADPPRVAVLGEMFEMLGTGLDDGTELAPPPHPSIVIITEIKPAMSAKCR